MSEYVLLLVSSSSKDGLLILSFFVFVLFFHLLKGTYEFQIRRNQKEKTNYGFGGEKYLMQRNPELYIFTFLYYI